MAEDVSQPGTPTARSAPESPQTAQSVQRQQTQGTQLMPLIVQYFKTAGLLFLVWVVGYFGFSATWVIVGLFFFVVNEQYRKVKEAKKKFAQQAVQNERQAILARVDELPSWVSEL